MNDTQTLVIYADDCDVHNNEQILNVLKQYKVTITPKEYIGALLVTGDKSELDKIQLTGLPTPAKMEIEGAVSIMSGK